MLTLLAPRKVSMAPKLANTHSLTPAPLHPFPILWHDDNNNYNYNHNSRRNTAQLCVGWWKVEL
jgi:hypothetical protein